VSLKAKAKAISLLIRSAWLRTPTNHHTTSLVLLALLDNQAGMLPSSIHTSDYSMSLQTLSPRPPLT